MGGSGVKDGVTKWGRGRLRPGWDEVGVQGLGRAETQKWKKFQDWGKAQQWRSGTE